jgi:hypothetical protein
VPPGSFATLTVREDTGQYTLGATFPDVMGEAHHINTTTYSGDPMQCLTGTKVEELPRGPFTYSWTCGGSGMFEVGANALDGTSMGTTGTMPVINAMSTWSFQRL